jgi:hypothetical protein
LSAVTSRSRRAVYWSITPLKIRESDGLAAFRESYPGFEHAVVECLLCQPDREMKHPPDAGELKLHL